MMRSRVRQVTKLEKGTYHVRTMGLDDYVILKLLKFFFIWIGKIFFLWPLKFIWWIIKSPILLFRFLYIKLAYRKNGAKKVVFAILSLVITLLILGAIVILIMYLYSLVPEEMVNQEVLYNFEESYGSEGKTIYGHRGAKKGIHHYIYLINYKDNLLVDLDVSDYYGGMDKYEYTVYNIITNNNGYLTVADDDGKTEAFEIKKEGDNSYLLRYYEHEKDGEIVKSSVKSESLDLESSISYLKNSGFARDYYSKKYATKIINENSAG